MDKYLALLGMSDYLVKLWTFPLIKIVFYGLQQFYDSTD